MSSGDSSPKPERQADIAEIVDQYIAALDAGAVADEEALCRASPHLMPELSEAIQTAKLIRDARLAADAEPLGDLDDSSPFSGNSRHSSSSPQPFGDYELIQRIGGGGFGSVYLAQHLTTGDAVAIKILKPDYARDPHALRRFRSESLIAKKLQHDHIVRISTVADYKGFHFLVMPFINGDDLRRFSRAKPIPAKEAARIMRDVARACHYAHEHNVIHRDIKPENILIDSATGQPLVTDFGLAKQMDASIVLTAPSQVLGTLNYMAPEQADPRLGPIGRAGDIYSLGATLYFLLTGKEPFPRAAGAGKEALVHEVLWDEPIPMERLNPSVPADLKTICRKCMEKMPVDRFATAEDLAADLDKVIADVPIATRLPGPIRRTRRLFQRRPAVAAALTGLVVSIGVGAWLSISFAFRAQRSESQLVSTTTKLTETKRKQILQGYAADMQDAEQVLAQGEMGRLSELLTKYDHPADFDPRGFEWQYLRNLCDSPSPVHFASQAADWNRLSFDATGKRLAAVDRNGALVVWDLLQSKEAYRLAESVHSVVFSGDKKHCVVLLSKLQGQVEVHDADDGSLLNSFGTGLSTSSMAIHPDGRRLITGTAAGDIHLWEIPSGRHIAEITAKFKRAGRERSLDIQHGVIFDLAFSPDGQFFVAGLEDGTAQIWNLAERAIVCRCPNLHSGPITGVVFSPDGKRIASQSFGQFEIHMNSYLNGEAKVWDSDTGKTISTFSPHRTKAGDHPVLSVTDGVIPFGQFRPAFSGDGKRVVTTGARTVQVWDAESGKLVDELTGLDGHVVAVAVSGDGKYVAGAGADHSVRVWPADGNQTYATVTTHNWGIRGTSLSPDGSRIAAVCEYGVDMSIGIHGQLYGRSENRCLRVWDSQNGHDAFQTQKIRTPFEQPCFSSNGQQVLCGGRQYDLTTNQSTMIGRSGAYEDAVGVEAVASADSTFVARLVAFAHDAELIRTTVTEPYATLQGHSDAITAIAISPDNQWVATGGKDKTVRLWSSRDGTLRHTFSAHTDSITALTFSADSSLLASGGMDRRIYVWNVADGSQAFLFHGHHREISGLAFTHDGRRLVSSSGLLRVDSTQSGEVLLWDMQTGLQCLQLSAGGDNVYCGVAISPDGTRIYASVNPVGPVLPGKIVAWSASARTR